MQGVVLTTEGRETSRRRRGAIKEKTEWRDDSAGHLPRHPPQTAKYPQQECVLVRTA